MSLEAGLPGGLGRTRKWVTFEDLLDDALEQGKLPPRREGDDGKTRRRLSTCSSSLSSSADLNAAQPMDFSQSLNGGQPVDFSNSQQQPLDFNQSLDSNCSSEDKYSTAFEVLRQGKSTAKVRLQSFQFCCRKRNMANTILTNRIKKLYSGLLSKGCLVTR